MQKNRLHSKFQVSYRTHAIEEVFPKSIYHLKMLKMKKKKKLKMTYLET